MTDAFALHFAKIVSVEQLLAEKERDPLPTEVPADHPLFLFYSGNRGIEFPQIQKPNEDTVYLMTLHSRLLAPAFMEEEGTDPLNAKALESRFSDLLSLLMPFSFFDASVPSAFGVNCRLSVPLWKQLRYNSSVMDRFHYSYSIFLHFFGWRMHNEETGELDRHRYWRDRYSWLENATDSVTGHTFYVYLTWILRFLITWLLHPFAVHLLLYIVQEMHRGRLLQLKAPWKDVWLEMLLCSQEVEKSSTARLLQLYNKLDESDSE